METTPAIQDYVGAIYDLAGSKKPVIGARLGKTTTAINLAAAIAQKKLKTLLVDLDPQANCTLSFIDHQQLGTTVSEALTEPGLTLKEAVHHTGDPNLDIIPSRITLAKFESKMIGELNSHYRLKGRLRSIQKDYQYIVMDTPPTLGLLTVNALVAATHLLVPIQSSYFALEGTDDLLETVEKIKSRPNPALEFLGVVITTPPRGAPYSYEPSLP